MNAASPKNTSIKTPIQQRSRDTLDRILSATQRLLETKRFSELSITEIAKAARCGVGTMYGRFANKNALLECLETRLIQTIVDGQQRFFESRDWSQIGFSRRVELLVAHLVKGYKKHRAVLRELVNSVHGRIDGPREDSRQAMTQLFQRDVDFLVQPLEATNKSRATKVVALGWMCVLSTLQNRMVQGQTSPIDQSFSESFFKTELPRMVIAYVNAAKLNS